MKFIILLAFLFIIVYFLKIKERFSLPQAKPLQLENSHMYDPGGWKWLYANVLTTTIKIKALTGQIDFENTMALPNLGFPSKSGGTWYSNINKLQGTDGWQIYNEARHGNDWFWWRPTPEWEKSSKANKLKELEVQLIITESSPTPEFPLSYSLRFQDYNYNGSVRFWLTLTHKPVPDNIIAKTLPKHLISSPLLLKYNNIAIKKPLWKINGSLANITIKIPIQQGKIDWSDIKSVKPTNNWFTWKAFLSGKDLMITGKINNTLKSPSIFPSNYMIRIKDKNMERYVYVTLSIEENPFTVPCS